MKRLIVTSFIILTIVLNSGIFAYADEDLGSWNTKESMQTARYVLGIIEVNGKIYAIGGNNGNSIDTVEVVEEYDPKIDKWTTKTSMTTPRHAIGVAEANGKIYAIGGENGHQLNTVEEYDPETDKWIAKTSMPTARSGLGAVEANGRIYAIGGYNDSNGCINTVEEYNPITDEWTTKTSMPSKRNYFGIAEVNGKIYVIGGYNNNGNLKTVEEYDPKTDKWTVKTSMPTARRGLGVAQVNEKIYAIGGFDGSNLNTVEEYDPQADEWTTKANMPTNRYYLGVTEANGKIYAIGGYNGSYLNTVEEYTPPQATNHQSITLSIEPENDKINLNNTVTVDLVIDNITDIAAEDIKIEFDKEKLEFLGFEEVDGIKLVRDVKESWAGKLRVITASKGEENIVNDKKVLLKLKFKAIETGQALVNITGGRVTDGITMEKDLEVLECGEGTITIGELIDVNNSGEFTLLDLGIDARHFSKDPESSELGEYHTDIVTNGEIDDEDLIEIAKHILENPNYSLNN